MLIGPCVVCVCQRSTTVGVPGECALQMCETNCFVGAPEEAFFVRESSQVGNFVG